MDLGVSDDHHRLINRRHTGIGVYEIARGRTRVMYARRVCEAQARREVYGERELGLQLGGPECVLTVGFRFLRRKPVWCYTPWE